MSRFENIEGTRRRFGGFLATSGLAAVAARRLDGAAPKPPAWIDAHVHIWTPDRHRYPLAEGFTVGDMRPPSFTPDELWAHARPQGVQRVVLIQMSFYRYDNRYMLDAIAASGGRFSGVGIVDYGAADVAERMKSLAKRGVRGFRINAIGKGARKWPDDDGMAMLWKTARDQNLAVCPLINPSDIGVIDVLCRKCEGTRVVVDHFARIGVSGRIEEAALKSLCRLARFPNVYVKVSAFYALGAKKPPYLDLVPMIRRVVDAFGPSRLMWASDCPYQVQGTHTYADSIGLIRNRNDFLSRADRESLLRKTAERVFFS